MDERNIPSAPENDDKPLIPKNEKGTDITTGLFDDETVLSKILPYLAILLQTCVVIFLFAIVSTPVVLQPSHTFSKDTRTVYTTLTTILGTLITIFTTSQIRTLWLRDIFEGQKPPADEGLNETRKRRARSLLSIGLFADTFLFWQVTASMGLVALITSAIAASVRDQPYLYKQQFQNIINPGLAPDQANCWSLKTDGDGEWGWRLTNGSFLAMAAGPNWGCAATMVPTLLDQAYVPSGYGFKYQVVGVPVVKQAVGTPFSAGAYHGFGPTFGALSIDQWGTTDFNSSSACVPNVVKNPVRCRTNGKVEPQSHRMRVTTDNCKSPWVSLFADPTSASANVFNMCTTQNEPGNATISYGSVHEYAINTATAMNDKDFAASKQTSYAVECTVDVGSSIGFRNVSFEQFELRQSDLGAKAFIVNGKGQACTPSSQDGSAAQVDRSLTPVPMRLDSEIHNDILLNIRTLVTGAASIRTLLSENAFNDGGKPSLHALLLAINNNDPDATHDYTFNDSRNPLEDALGLTVAAVLGQYWGGSQATVPVANASALVLSSNWALINTQRMGTGKWSNIVFTVPMFFAIGVIVMFLVRRYLRQRNGWMALLRTKTL